MPSAVAWLMNRSRQSGLVSESKVTTLPPAWRASFSAPQMASLSLADDDDHVGALLRQRVDVADLRADALASDGPVSLYSPLNSSTATLPPVVGGVEVRVVDLLGQEGDLQAPGDLAFGSAVGPASAAGVGCPWWCRRRRRW